MTEKDLVKILDGDDCDEFLEFDHIPEKDRLSTRADLHAFLLLDRLLPGQTGDIVGGADHDVIYLNVDTEKLAQVASRAQIIDLKRCGVLYEGDTDSLAMYV